MRALTGLLVAGVLSGCVLDELGVGKSGVNPDAIFAAQSTDELIALGAVRLMEEDIIDLVAGQTLVEPNEDWSWRIEEDGTHKAFSNIPDWEDAPGGLWQIVENRFCRENQELALRCSEVWQVGDYYRFVDDENALAPWTVVQS